MRPICSIVTFLVVAVLCAAEGFAVEADEALTSTIPTVASIGKNLGVQVRRAMIMRGDVGPDKNGRPVLYTALLGAPAVLSVVDVATAKVVGEYPMPDTSGAWAVKVSPDGTVYLGAYNLGLLYRFFPKTGEMKNLGHPFKSNDTVLYPMDVASDGKVYGGSYPSGHAYEYDPKTAAFRDLGDMTTVTARERWIRVTVLDPKANRLYFGIGNQPQLVEYDLSTGKKRDILPAKYSNITSVYDLNVEGGRAFCRKETHNPYEYFVLDLATGREVTITNADTGETSSTFINGSRGLSPKSPDANRMYYVGYDRELCEYDLDSNSIRSLKVKFPSVITGYTWVRLDDPAYPGYTLVGTVGNGGALYKYNPKTGKHDIRAVQYTGQPVNIREMVAGPDGRIYSGGYLAGNMGVYNPESGKVTHLYGSGQTEGLVFIGDRLFMGVYPGAGVYEYDTAKPWDAGDLWKPSLASSKNPTRIFSLEDNKDIPGYTNQDRPFGMAGSEELQKLFVGTVPKNGMLGGVLAVYDLKTRGNPEVYWNLVPNQSIVTLACKDGLVYGGTSVFGGMGVTPKEKEGRLFVWDVTAKRLLASMVPVAGKPAVNSLLVGPDGNIWGIAGGTLFVFDPAKRQVVYSKEELPGVSSHYREGSLISGKDGNVYGAIGGRLFRVSPKSKEFTILARGAHRVAQDKQGLLYVNGEPITELVQVDPASLGAKDQ